MNVARDLYGAARDRLKSAGVKAGPDAFHRLTAGPGHAFSTECESTHRCLQWLIREVGIDLPTEEMDVTYHQLKNKEIIISIHGRHNCGKTTVINALLGHSLLPMSLFNETGVTVRIEHDGTVHEGKCPTYRYGCQHCPKLTSNAGESIQGCEKICERLEKVNEEVRTAEYQASSQRVKCEFTLTTNMPMLASAQGGWKIVMLDNPGFGESHQEHMTQRTKTTLKTSSAYLVVMDIGQLNDEEDERCLKLIHEGDKGAFDSHGRVLVAVTKYDSMYQERPKKRKSEKEIKKRVQQNVNAATGRGISDDAIVLVCGKWALHARLLQRDPDDVHSQQIVMAGLSLVDAPSGQKEDSFENKAVTMEGKTKIKEVESKIQEMVSRCAYIWIDTMTANYQRYIKAGLDMLTPKLEEKKEHLRDAEAVRDELMEYYTEATNLRARIQLSMQQRSEVHEELHRSARRDVQATKDRVVQLVQEFGLRCAKRFDEDAQRQYGESDLKKDITQLLNDEVKPAIVVEICNASEKFCETVRYESATVGDVDNDINSMKEKARRYIQLRPECQYLPIVVHVEGVAAAEPAGNEEERAETAGNEEERAETAGNEEERAETVGNEEERAETAGNEEERAETAGNEEERAETVGNEEERAETAGNEEERAETAGNEEERVETAGNEEERAETAGNEEERAEPADNEEERAEPAGKEEERAETAGNEEERAIDLGGLDAVFNREMPTFEDLQKHLNIPSLRISWFAELRRFFHRHFPRMFDAPGRIDRSNEVAEVVEQLQQLTGAMTEEYLRDFEQIVADFFFQKYCQSVRSKIQDFEQQLGEKLDVQKRNDDRQVESLRAEVQQLEAKKTDLESNQSKIAEKAKKYISALGSADTASRPVQDPVSCETAL